MQDKIKELIAYEDDDVLVVLKPPGIAVETKRIGEEDLVSLLRKYRKAKGKTDYSPAPINRLDQPVSGLVLFAQNKKAASILSAKLQGGDFTKIYEAEIFGSFEEKEGTLVSYLYKDAKTNTSRAVAKGDGDFTKAKKAVLEYEQIRPGKVRIRLHTGRHHQIRVQLSEAGHPILGDMKYGNEESKRESDRAGIKKLMLTACELSFTHPTTGKRMTFTVNENNTVAKSEK